MDGYQEMDMEDMEMEPESTTDVAFEALRGIIEKPDEEGKDQAVQARDANYISKGTYIWQLLA